MKKHFVTFYSPGTFVSENTTREIVTWSVDEAADMAHAITERHGATPYAFRFTTRELRAGEFDHKETARSGLYFLGGVVWTIADVRARNDPKERTLLANMEGNGYERVVCNNNSWRWVVPLGADDVVLDWKPKREVQV